MKKGLLSALIIPVLFLSTVTITEASTKVMWGKTEFVKGQIGKVTVLNTTQIYQNNNDGIFKQSTRSLRKGEEFRVYSYKGQDGGYYGLGGGLFAKKSTVVKYETPSKAKLKLLEDNSLSSSSKDSEKYPDGWVAPVSKSTWSSNQANNYTVLQNELGFSDGGRSYNVRGVPGAIQVISQGGSGSYEVGIKFRGWVDNSIPETYRIPIVAKELFKFYFGGDGDRILGYFNNNDIPEQFTANGRAVKASFSQADGAIYLEVGKRNN
ncbi:hypothetical protein PGC35_07140 [Psychrobacillus sp. PGGUH221]|uniref:hypothetical protein n=1 Tax=Psychrobacillus sp. PGGUH221 TaxID=3020058 RepID=UPI0035C7438F